MCVSMYTEGGGRKKKKRVGKFSSRCSKLGGVQSAQRNGCAALWKILITLALRSARVSNAQNITDRRRQPFFFLRVRMCREKDFGTRWKSLRMWGDVTIFLLLYGCSRLNYYQASLPGRIYEGLRQLTGRWSKPQGNILLLIKFIVTVTRYSRGARLGSYIF